MGPLFLSAAFVAGACLLHAGAVALGWNDPAVAFVVLPGLAALLAPRRFVPRPMRGAALMLLFFAAGFCWADFRAELRLQKKLPPELIWRDIVAEGEVFDLPRRRPGRTRFDFRIDKIEDGAGAAVPLAGPLAARITEYHRGREGHPGLRDGARLRVTVRLRPPSVAANPGGFEYGDYLFARDIQLLGYVRNRRGAGVAALSPGAGWREQLRDRALRVLPPPQNGLLAAFVTGDRSGISEDTYEALRRAGVAHLVSVSGAHIGLAAGLAALLVALLWRRWPRLTALMPAGRAALLLALPFAFGYALLAGFGVPVRRSFLMLTFAALAILSGRIPSPAAALALAGLVIVAVDPWAAVAPGFWLSFALVGAVVFAFAGAGAHPLWRFVRAQTLVAALAAPLTLLFFNEASLISPVANVIAVPVVGLAVLPLALADVFAPGDALWRLAGRLLGLLWKAIEWLAALRYAAWSPAAPPWWLLVAAVVGGGWLLAPAGFPFKWAGLPPLAAALLWHPPPPAGLRLVFFNAGQGAAAVAHAGGRTLLYDAGPGFVGPWAIAPYLRAAGVRRLDAAVISHDDSDHRGGADEALRRFPTDRLFASFPMQAAAADGTAVAAERCAAGRHWRWGKAEFVFLHPHPEDYGRDFSDNAMSCVLKITTPWGSALLPGDIPGGTELVLLERAGGALAAEVLLAPHHGSRYSSEADFLSAVGADYAVFSAGARNRFGHPHPDALARAAAAGAEILRTDLHGAIVADFSPAGLRVEKWRERRNYRWADAADDDGNDGS